MYPLIEIITLDEPTLTFMRFVSRVPMAGEVITPGPRKEKNEAGIYDSYHVVAAHHFGQNNQEPATKHILRPGASLDAVVSVVRVRS